MSRWLLAAIAAAVVLADARDVHADALADARKAVDSSDYPSARTSLTAALEAGTAGPDELADIYKLSGIVEAALGNADAATAAFARWLSLDAKGSLPFGTSPKIMRPFEAAQASAKRQGRVEAKTETGDDPPSVTLVVVNDPQALIVGARVYFRIDRRGAEQMLSADGTERVKIDLEPGKRLDLRVHAIDRHGNRVVELGSKDVPIVITSSGTTKQLTDPTPREPRTPPSPRSWYAQWWVWGLATGVSAGVAGVFAYRTRSALGDLDALNANSYAHPWADAQAVEDRARRDLLITNISLGVAGAFAIGTTLLYLTRPTYDETPRAAVTPIPGGGAIVLGGHF